MQELQTVLKEISGILDKGRKQNQSNYNDEQRRDLRELAKSLTYKPDYKDSISLRAAGTCEWFFSDNRFRNWRDSSTSSLLWLSAGAGYGKSVLSRALVNKGRLLANLITSIICYYFFNESRGVDSCLKALRVILY